MFYLNLLIKKLPGIILSISFICFPLVGNAALTGVWTGLSGAGAGSATIAAGADAALTITSNNAVNANGGTFFTNSGATILGVAAAYTSTEGNIVGDPAFRYEHRWDANSLTDCDGTSTWTHTFARPIYDPVLHLDRIGGNLDNVGTFNDVSTSSLTTITTSPPGGVVERLSGIGPRFEVSGNTIFRTPNVNPVNFVGGGNECTTTGVTNNNTACGTVRINGLVSSVTMFIQAHPSLAPANHCTTTNFSPTAGDAIELIWEVNQDLSDAPASYGDPVHGIRTASGTLFLGNIGPDDEINSQHSANAAGDGADEDGLGTLLQYIPAGGMNCNGYVTLANEYCAVVSVTNNTTNPAQLVSWLDFGAGNGSNPDGTFNVAERSLPDLGGSGPGALVANSSGNAADGTFTTGNIEAGFSGDVVLVWTGLGVIDAQSTNQTYLRLRLTSDASFFSDASPLPTGGVADGEVEDHLVAFDILPVILSSVATERSGDKVTVDWATSSELFNVGFQLWGLDGTDQKWERLHNWLVKSGSGHAVEPQNYRKRVRLPKSIDQLVAVGISSVDSDGREHYYGPFELGKSYGNLAKLKPIAWDDVRAELDRSMAAKGYVKDRVNGYRKIKTARTKTSVTTPAVESVVTLNVSEDGMYRMTAGDLLNAGLDLREIPKSEIALIDHTGTPVMRYVLARGTGNGNARTLGSNGELYFYGQSPKGNAALYSQVSHYRVVVDRYRALSARVQGKQGVSDGFSAHYREQLLLEKDDHYSLAAQSDDPWIAGTYTSYVDRASTVGDVLTLPDRVLLDEPLVLLAGLGRGSGLSPVDANDDGIQDAEHIFSGAVYGADGQAHWLDSRSEVGRGPWPVAIDVPVDVGDVDPSTPAMDVLVGGSLRAGSGYAFSQVQLDYLGLEYAREYVAKAGDGYLSFSGPNTGESGYEVIIPETGWVSAFAHDGSNLVRLVPEKQVKQTLSGKKQRVVKVAALNGAGTALASQPISYWVSGRRGYLRPTSIQVDSITSQQELLTQAQGSNYLLITHPTFDGPVLQGFAAHKRGLGHTVSVVDYLAVVNAFGAGQPGPHGLTAYLSKLQAQGGVDNVLLVGGSVYDHHDQLGTGAMTFIPGHYGESQYSRFTVSDAPYIADTNGELFASIGRWPVRTDADLSTIVAKSTAWDNSPRSSARAVVLAEHTVAGENIDFAQALSAQVMPMMPPSWPSELVSVDAVLQANPGLSLTQALTAAKAQFIDQLNGGAALVVYNGHGTTSQLSNKGLFKASDVGLISHTGGSVWLPLSCYMTFTESTHVNTLAHQLLFEANATHISGAMLLSDQGGNIAAGRSILDKTLNQGQSIGAAITAHKTAQANPALTINWALLGDPSTIIRTQ